MSHLHQNPILRTISTKCTDKHLKLTKSLKCLIFSFVQDIFPNFSRSFAQNCIKSRCLDCFNFLVWDNGTINPDLLIPICNQFFCIEVWRKINFCENFYWFLIPLWQKFPLFYCDVQTLVILISLRRDWLILVESAERERLKISRDVDWLVSNPFEYAVVSGNISTQTIFH